jgi:hypothetical protein
VTRFLIKDVTFREHNHELFRIDRVKIVACEAKAPPAAASKGGDNDGEAGSSSASTSGGSRNGQSARFPKPFNVVLLKTNP